MESTRSTVRDLRRRNRSVLLSRLFFDAPLSRLELSQLSGLSGATVSNVTGELVEEGLIVEAGTVDSDGGRPRVLLRVNPAFGHVIGVDVGETGVKAELFDLTMRPLATVEQSLRSPRSTPDIVVGHIATGIQKVLAAAGVAPDSILGVGIGVPGAVEQGGRVRVHAQAIGWDAVPLVDGLRAAGVRLPLYVDNGAKTQGQAEMWFGAGRGARHAVVALVGSGVGAAVITDGRTHQGATSSACEWGHTCVAYGGRSCRCGSRGCLEAYVGAEAILERYRQARRGRPAPGTDEQSRLQALIDAAPRSQVATTVLDDTAGYLGAGIANLINLFSPDRVVLGGWAGLAVGSVLLPRIRAAAEAHALRHAYAQTRIDLCELGPDAVAVGAATLPVAAMLALGADPRTDQRSAGARARPGEDAA
jgi:predicted NBD/HSP70 family sugar kinase